MYAFFIFLSSRLFCLFASCILKHLFNFLHLPSSLSFLFLDRGHIRRANKQSSVCVYGRVCQKVPSQHSQGWHLAIGQWDASRISTALQSGNGRNWENGLQSIVRNINNYKRLWCQTCMTFFSTQKTIFWRTLTKTKQYCTTLTSTANH